MTWLAALRSCFATDPGRRGERYAASWLRKRGYRILHRNLRIGKDEIDLVALDQDSGTIVIVEVKTRTTEHHAPQENVNARKRRYMLRIAGALATRAEFAHRPMRFDVIAVTWLPGKRPVVRHFPNAFDA
jgi:putative endonuclease